MTPKQRPWKRRRILVQASFQVKYALFLAGVAAVIMLVLGTLYVRSLGQQTRLLGLQKVCGASAGLQDSEFERDLQAEARQADTRTALLLVGVATALVIVLAYGGIRASFRAAGPVYAVSRMLRSMALGDLNAVRRLRSGDDFRFLEEDVLALKEYMVNEAEADVSLMQNTLEAVKLASAHPGGGEREVMEEVARELTRAISQKKVRYRLDERSSHYEGNG